jgi:hypothetical protein
MRIYNILLTNNYIVYTSLFVAFILWIITISSVTITEITGPFYVFSVLPLYYWFGIFIIISIFIFKYLYNLPIQIYLDYLFIVLFCLYLYGTFSIIIENPRFMDVYTHSGLAIKIINNTRIEGARYLEENPLAFAWFAIFKLIIQLDTFTLLKINGVILPLFVAIILYSLGRYISYNHKYSLVTAVSFLGLFFIDQGHFSPQMIALIYMILIISYLFIYFNNKRLINHKLSSISLIVLLIIMIVFTNATTTIAFNIILISYLITRLFMITLKKDISYRNIFSDYRILFILSIIITLIWAIYIGYRTLNEIIFRIKSLFVNISTLSNLSIKTGVAPLYFYFNLLQYLIASLVIISGCIIVYILIKKNLWRSSYIGMLIFITFVVIIPITLFQLGEESSTFLQRTYMYALLGWSMLTTLVIGKLNNIILHHMIFGIIVLSIVMFPITKYGGDFANYVPSSLLYTANLLTHDSSVVITSTGTGKHPSLYEASINKTDISTANLQYYNYNEENLKFRINHIIAREINRLSTDNIFVIISERDSIKYSLIKNDDYFINFLKHELNKSTTINRIVDSTQNKVYKVIF